MSALLKKSLKTTTIRIITVFVQKKITIVSTFVKKFLCVFPAFGVWVLFDVLAGKFKLVGTEKSDWKRENWSWSQNNAVLY